METTKKKTKTGKKLISKTVAVVTVAEEQIDAVVSEPVEPAAVVVVKKPTHKKKAKLIVQEEILPCENDEIGNIILHLNCSMDDLERLKKQHFKDPLEYNPDIPLDIQTYESPHTNNTYQAVLTPVSAYQPICRKCNEVLTIEMMTSLSASLASTDAKAKENSNEKIRDLKKAYFLNQMEWNKSSACFWCTCEFDHEPVYLPHSETNETLTVYGTFCTPECATAYLFHENIDDNQKFERYHLLNKMYISPNGTNIKPAPSPFFLLDKYLGTLTIQEYRQMLQKQQHTYLVTVDKPMTRILPELHTEGETISNMSTYKIKRPSELK